MFDETDKFLAEFDAAWEAEHTGHNCECVLCAGELDAKIVTRPGINGGVDEYIVVYGRILTEYGAPVSRSEDAHYYLHENVASPIDDGRIPPGPEGVFGHFAGEWWPETPGMFTPEDLVDLYRVLKRERNG